MRISNDFYYLSEIEEIIFILEKGDLFRINRVKERGYTLIRRLSEELRERKSYVLVGKELELVRQKEICTYQ